MTRKATPFARHPLPSPGSPVCVCLGAGQLRGAGGRGAGCAGLRPFLSSGGSLWGCASGEVCWLPPLRSSEGREEAWQLGSKGALGHLGPFHPEPGHIPPPASSLRTQRCAAGACALPSCPHALAHSRLAPCCGKGTRVLARGGPTQLQVPCHGPAVPPALCPLHPEQDLYPAPVLGVLRPLFSQCERGFACGHGVCAR